MVRTTAVLLIVHTFSSAAYSADEPHKDPCDCRSQHKLVLALPDDVANVEAESKRKTDRQDAVTFDWMPQVRERRWIYVVIHHTGTESGSVESIDVSHRQRKDSLGNPWLGIGYHFLIGNGSGMDDGAVEATFRWNQQIHGAHSGSTVHNANGIGVCLVGNFQDQPPSHKQRKAVTRLVTQLSNRYDIPARLVIGHDTIKPTLCPGRYFPLHDVIRDSVSSERTRTEF